MGNRRIIGPVAVMLLVAGCKQGASVSIDQVGGTVVATATRGSEPACVDDLDVTEVSDGSGEFGPVTWRIVTADIDRCVSRFSLGVVPTGFAQEAPMVPLVSGRQYRVAVSGTGFVGTQVFTAAAAPTPPG